MVRALSGMMLGGLALLAVDAGLRIAAAASTLHLGCEVTNDGGWGEFYFRNNSTALVPVGSTVDWRTSSGKSGRLQLDQQIAPGQRRYINSVFHYQLDVDYGAKCIAVVTVAPASAFDNLGIIQRNPAMDRFIRR